MAKVKKSLNSMIKTALHRPLSKDGYPLYATVAGYKSTGGNGDTEASKSDIWKKQSTVSYNSPTNIRKVFITGAGVTVQYYGAPIINKNSGDRWKTTRYPGKNLFDIASEIIQYQDKRNKYLMSKNIDPNAVEPDEYILTGNALGVLSNPYTCNNVEEVYFDWTILFSDDVKQYLPSISLPEAIMSFAMKTTGPQEIPSNEIVNFFGNCTSGGVKDLRKRYPRLRYIGFISNLQEVLDHPNHKVVDRGFDSIEESAKTWYEVNRDLIAASGSYVLIGKTDNLPKVVTDFTVKNTQYKYDQDKLKILIDQYLTKVKDYNRSKTYGSNNSSSSKQEEQAEQNEVTEAGAFEQRLLEIEATYGDKVLKNCLLFSVSGSGLKKDELQSIFNSFTSKNRAKYKAMVGLK